MIILYLCYVLKALKSESQSTFASRQWQCRSVLVPKSLHISPAIRHFYGTEYEIWVGFGSVGST